MGHFTHAKKYSCFLHKIFVFIANVKRRKTQIYLIQYRKPKIMLSIVIFLHIFLVSFYFIFQLRVKNYTCMIVRVFFEWRSRFGNSNTQFFEQLKSLFGSNPKNSGYPISGYTVLSGSDVEYPILNLFCRFLILYFFPHKYLSSFPLLSLIKLFLNFEYKS